MPMLESRKITRILRGEDIKKASVLLGIDEATLTELNDRCLLNVEYIREMLVKEDWKKLTSGLQYLVEKNKAYTYPEVSDAICQHWDISKQYLKVVIASKNVPMMFCPKCGRRVEPKAVRRLEGICTECFAKSLNV